MMREKLRTEENELIAQVQKAQNDLLAQVERNPKRWNSRNLRIKIICNNYPYVGIEFLEFLCDFKFAGPISPDDHWQTVGQIKCYKNFELTFECKIDTQVSSLLQIGDWFGLSLRSKGDGNKTFGLKQANGLYNDKLHHDTNSIFGFPIGDWNKEN